MTALWIILGLLSVYVLWQYVELQKFKVTKYHVSSEKLNSDQRWAVLADLHGFTYGKKNERLLRQIQAFCPQAILIAGDMIVSEDEESYGTAYDLLRRLTPIAPVYYAFGNHESRGLRLCEATANKTFAEYLQRAEELGVIFLHNETKQLVVGSDTLAVSGLELDLHYYRKRKEVPMERDCMKKLLGEADREHFQILIAHNPAYSEEYAAWGADLTVCGHNHGGLIRLPGHGSLFSPQLTFFPKYDGGQYAIAGKQVIVSRGLGTHTFHIRIFNRAELVLVQAEAE